jgi:polygalacturonase
MGTLLDGSFRKFPATDKVLRQGGIKCGTESNGGFQNIAISNCVLEGCRGIQIESVDGALAEDICISNITMRDIQTAPLFMRLGSRMRGPTGIPIGKLRRVLVNNIVCSNSVSRFASILSGIPGHWIEDIKISNVFIQHQGGAPAAQAALQPQERETRRPESGMFGPMPAQGFFLRHVRNLSMSHIEVVPLAPDARPSFVLDDVADSDFFGVKCSQTAGVPIFALHDVEQFNVRFSRGLADTSISKAVKQDLYASL